jgi:hypothetical protein
MSRKRYSPEKNIGILREAEVALSHRDGRVIYESPNRIMQAL